MHILYIKYLTRIIFTLLQGWLYWPLVNRRPFGDLQRNERVLFDSIRLTEGE